MATIDKVLDTLREAGPKGLDVGELPDKAGVSKASVTKALNALTEQQLIRKKGDRISPVLRRGRRLIRTEERDVQVMDLIVSAGEDGVTLTEVANKLDISRSLAYQAVWRLSHAKRVKRTGVTRTTRWVATDAAVEAA